jgi:hypothetical protein
MPLSSFAMFDRTETLEAIRSACLGIRGESGVLICAHKSGKSFLLDHIYESRGAPDLIFCRVNPDMLLAEQTPTAGSLDQAFLHHLLRRLHLELERLTEEPVQDEARLSNELCENETHLVELGGGPDQSARRALLTQNVEALRVRLREIRTIQKIVSKAAELLEQETIGNSAVASLIERLAVARKRMVLLIDDYHCVVKGGMLSDSIFTLLRGASREGTVITIATSPMSLMDRALHNGNESRSALFNHFRAQVLRPFKDHQANQFLDWLSGDQPPLTSQEKDYLRGLSGGSPYFLRNSHEEFMRRGRPQNGPEREQMESEIEQNLGGALRDLLTRCSPARRAIVSDVASENGGLPMGPDVRALLDDGYLVEVPGGYRISSRLLAGFIRQQPKPDMSDGVTATVSLPYRIFPTALFYAHPESCTLVTFRLHNPTSSRIKVVVRCELVGLSDEFLEEVEVEPDDCKIVGLTVVLREEAVRKLVDPQFRQLNYSAEMSANDPRHFLARANKPLRVMPLDYYVFARTDMTRERLVEFSWLIAAWINHSDRRLEDIRMRARERLRRPEGFCAYTTNDPDRVLEIVESLYDALKAHGLVYDNSALVFHREHEEFAQRVRLPGRVLQHKAGNCLETCVVFANLLSASDLHPIILFLPGHAIAGWKERDAANAGWQFIETTGIGSDSFSQAHRKGQEQYEGVRSLCEKWLTRPSAEIRNAAEFAIPVDIHHIKQEKQLGELPSHHDE